jgi:hypothetical protein
MPSLSGSTWPLSSTGMPPPGRTPKYRPISPVRGNPSSELALMLRRTFTRHRTMPQPPVHFGPRQNVRAVDELVDGPEPGQYSCDLGVLYGFFVRASTPLLGALEPSTLLTRMSRPPRRSMTSRTTLPTPSGVLMSVWTNNAAA